MLTLTYGPVMMKYSCKGDIFLEESLVSLLTVENPDDEENPEVLFMHEEERLIPTGLLQVIQEFAEKLSIPLTLAGWPEPEKFKEVTPDIIPGITLRPYQVESVQACLKKGRGVIEIATGGGKTEIAIALTLVMGKPRTVYICPDVNSMRGMYERYKKRGFTEDEIGRLGGNYSETDRPIVIAVIASLYSGLKRGKGDILDILEESTLMLADEVHHKGTALSWQLVAAACQARYRFGMSGTPYKDIESRDCTNLHPNDTWLTSYTGPAIMFITTGMLQSIGMLTKCRYINFPAGGSSIPGFKWHRAQKEGIHENYTRSLRCVTIAANLADMGAKPLISISKLHHGRVMQYMLHRRNIPVACSYGGDVTIVPREILQYMPDVEYEEIPMDLPFSIPTTGVGVDEIETHFVKISPEVDIMDLFRRGIIQVLIGSTIYDEAADIIFLTDLINASGGKSPQRFRQKVGRVLRLSKGKNIARIWDPWDSTHIFLNKHSLKRREVIIEEGYAISDRDPEEMYTFRLKDLRVFRKRRTIR